MRIGLDFDGTIVLYDDVFHRCAVECFRMPQDVAANKPAVRGWLRNTPDGEHKWIELQGMVYGTRMEEATVAPGLESFLSRCGDAGIQVSIISHKTERPVIGPPVNLREAARRWLERSGFYSRLGIRPQDVFFENTRQEKIRQIEAQRCAKFIDDLEDVLLEPAFPRAVEKLLYARGRADDLSGDIKIFSGWDALGAYLMAGPAGVYG